MKEHTGFGGEQLNLLCNQLTWLFADHVEFFWEGISV